MKKDTNKPDKKENINVATNAEVRDQNYENLTSDKISEKRETGGLTERDDAPGSGIGNSDATEHTLGNP